MRPGMIVIEPPGFDDLACFGQALEDVLVETLFAQLAVERFYERILYPCERINSVTCRAQCCGSPS